MSMWKRGNGLLAVYCSVPVLVIVIALAVVIFSRRNVERLARFSSSATTMSQAVLPLNNIAFELERLFGEAGRLLSAAIDSGDQVLVDEARDMVPLVAEQVRRTLGPNGHDPQLEDILNRFQRYIKDASGLVISYIQDPESVAPEKLARLSRDIATLKDDIALFRQEYSARLQRELHTIERDSSTLSHEHGRLVPAIVFVAMLSIVFSIASSVATYHLLKANRALTAREVQINAANRKLMDNEKELVEKTETLAAQRTELERALGQLKEVQTRLIQQQRLSALGKMASGIAHDFNNVLVPIVGLSEALMKDEVALLDQKKVRETLGLIFLSAQDACGIVTRLREFYRPEEELESAPVDVAATLKKAISLTAPVWKAQAGSEGRHITTHVNVVADTPAVMANERQLREVLTNLILNAVDAMPAGGTINLSAESCSGQVVISVCDDGMGMTEEVKRQCFDPFFSTKGSAGTGLGLAMCAGIIERHGGRMEVDSTRGQGTCIRLYLPATRDHVSQRTVQQQGTLNIRPLRILIVDDEKVIRTTMSRLLAADKHTVKSTRDAAEAIKIIREADEPFDLIITDRSMPGMSGDELALEAKKVQTRTAIIMLTGFGDMMSLRGEQPSGVDLVLSKPITRDMLRQGIVSVLGT